MRHILKAYFFQLLMVLFLCIVTLWSCRLMGAEHLLTNPVHRIQAMPTIIYLTIGLMMLGGLAFGHPLMKFPLVYWFSLPESGWRTHTWRWGLFFLALAGTNEIVWRLLSISSWVNYKVYIVLPLIMTFTALQVPLLMRRQEWPEST